MRRLAVATTVFLAVIAGGAEGSSTRSCGVVGGWHISANAQTTTCGLARSASRQFVISTRHGRGVPARITGTSPKTGRRYTFTHHGSGLIHHGRIVAHVYVGHAGQAILRMTISSTLY